MKKLSFALTALALLSGCFSLERAHSPEPGRDQLFVSNFGWYLFRSVPLACGNADPARSTDFVLFRDDVCMDRIQTRFFDYCRDNGVKPTNLVYHNEEEILFSVPGLEFPLPIPYLITYREMQLSGVLEKNENKEAK